MLGRARRQKDGGDGGYKKVTRKNVQSISWRMISHNMMGFLELGLRALQPPPPPPPPISNKQKTNRKQPHQY